LTKRCISSDYAEPRAPEGYRAGRGRIAAAQAEVLRAVVHGLASSRLSDVRLGSPPPHFAEAPELGQLGTVWVYVTVDVRNEPVAQVRANWEAWLVIGAVREMSHDLGLPDVLGGTTRGIAPGPVSSVAGQPFGLKTAPAAAISSRIAARLKDSPLFASAETDFVQPYGAAPIVTVNLAPGVELAPGESAAIPIFGVDDDCEGIFLYVRDQTGEVVRVAAYAARTGWGSGWGRPDVGLDGIPIGGPFSSFAS
jgi:hypothetical protein